MLIAFLFLFMITVKIVETENEFNEAIKLRYELLRLPLNLPEGSEVDELETSAVTIIALKKEQIIGTGRIHSVDEKTMQIRFMAVRKDFQNKRIGAKILVALEQIALLKKVSEIILNARNEIKHFYIKNGYTVIGEPFESVGICHVSMSKILK